MDFITITIDGQKVRALKGENLVDAAKRVKIDIPALCYDKNLEIVSSCRLCVVEVVGQNKLVTACSTFVEEGMEVLTTTDEIVQIRKDILRLLLDNHPNDCLTCQSSGECLLQEYAYRYDVKFRDHDGARRGQENSEFTDTSSPYILRDESKCILCGRCIRSCGEIETRAVLSFSNRGFDTRVIADQDQSLEESNCVSCNRCVSVCPVGALIDRRAYLKARPLVSQKKQIKCTACDYGCNMELLMNRNKVEAVRADAPMMGRPLCLKGRLKTEANYLSQPEQPYEKIKVNGKNEFVETSWSKALELEGVYRLLAEEERSKGDEDDKRRTGKNY